MRYHHPQKGKVYQKNEAVSWYISVMDWEPARKDRQRAREEILKCVEMSWGLSAPRPMGFHHLHLGTLDSRRREIEECGHDYSWIVFAVASCGRLLHSGVFKQKPGGQCSKEEEGVAWEVSLGGSQGHRFHAWPSRQPYSPLWRKTTGNHERSMWTSVVSTNQGMETHSFHQVSWHLLPGRRWGRVFTVALVLPWLEWCLSFANRTLPMPAGCRQCS